MSYKIVKVSGLGLKCSICGTKLKKGDEYEHCEKCGAIFCATCAKGGKQENHDCVKEESSDECTFICCDVDFINAKNNRTSSAFKNAKTYSYLAGNLPVKIGCKVTAMFGQHHTPQEGAVRSISVCTINSAPYDTEKMSHLLTSEIDGVCYTAVNSGMTDDEIALAKKRDEEQRQRMNSLQGKNIVVTGKIPGMTRADVERYVLQHGGYFQTAVRRDTDYLVIGVKPGSTKLRDAHNHSIEKIDYTEFFKKFGNASMHF